MVGYGNVPHSHALREGRTSLPNHAYFITKCTLPVVAPLLIHSECAEVVIRSLLWARDDQWWRILGFIIMPGHYHIAIGLGEKKSLSEAIEGVSRFTANQINDVFGRKGTFWEEGFYDHAIRDRQDYDNIITYMHNNPVAAGLVAAEEAWSYSTANERYACEIDWDWLGVSVPKVTFAKHRFDPKKLPQRYL